MFSTKWSETGKFHLNFCPIRNACFCILFAMSCPNEHSPVVCLQSPVGSRAAQALQLSQQQQFNDKKFDLLSDLGGDIFAAPSHSQTAAGLAANFANFAHFNSHPGKQEECHELHRSLEPSLNLESEKHQARWLHLLRSGET